MEDLSKLKTFGERSTAVLERTTVTRAMHTNDVARNGKMSPKRVKNIFNGNVEAKASEALFIATELDVPVEYLISGKVKEEPERECGGDCLDGQDKPANRALIDKGHESPEGFNPGNTAQG